jgi:maleate cis-trans isomerase
MYAWRARIGLVHPTHRGKTFALWYKHAPEGVEIVPTFIGFRQSTTDTFAAGIQRAEELADDLKSYGCTIVAISGSPPYLLKGPEFEQRWAESLSRKLDLPVVTPMLPHVEAMKAMGLKSVAVATYYNDELNQAIVDYFAHFGIKGHALGGYARAGAAEALYSTSLSALDAVSHHEVYQYCKEGFRRLGGRVDGIYINGGGWDAAPAVDYLEQDLGTKVVFALAAEQWLVYEKLDIDNRFDGFGSLTRDGYHATTNP